MASLSYLPRPPVASHDFLLPPTTFCCLPRLPAASHDFLPPPTTPCCLPRLLLPPTTPSLRPLGEIPEIPCPGLLLGRGDRIKSMMTAQKRQNEGKYLLILSAL